MAIRNKGISNYGDRQQLFSDGTNHSRRFRLLKQDQMEIAVNNEIQKTAAPMAIMVVGDNGLVKPMCCWSPWGKLASSVLLLGGAPIFWVGIVVLTNSLHIKRQHVSENVHTMCYKNVGCDLRSEVRFGKRNRQHRRWIHRLVKLDNGSCYQLRDRCGLRCRGNGARGLLY
jgi:hypothetical protein